MEEHHKKEAEEKKAKIKPDSGHKKDKHQEAKKEAEKKEHKKEEKSMEYIDEDFELEKAEPARKNKGKMMMEDSKLESAVIILTAIFLIIVIFNQYQIYSINMNIKENIREAEELKKPASIELYIIADRKCDGCYDISGITESIKNNKNLNITSSEALSFDSEKTKGFISKYGIKNLPAIVIKGDIDKAQNAIQGTSKMDDALIFQNLPPPYYEVAANEIRGLVTLMHIKDSSCGKCSGTSSFGAQLMATGVKIAKEETLDAKDVKANELMKKYKIEALPTVILSPDASYYPVVAEAWPRIGSKEDDGSYVMRNINPPYLNVSSGKVSGIVNVTLLTDKSCSECYNATLHREILEQGFRITIGNLSTFDISDKKGKGLVEKYRISAVPTVIVSEDAKYYNNFVLSWKGVGSTESDGSFVFRKFEAWPGQTYKDLATNTIVENPAPQQ